MATWLLCTFKGLPRSHFETSLRSGWPQTHNIVHLASSYWVLDYRQTTPCTAAPCTAAPCTATPCTTTPCTATPCTTIPCTATPCTATPCKHLLSSFYHWITFHLWGVPCVFTYSSVHLGSFQVWAMWYSHQPLVFSCGYTLSVHLRKCRGAQVLGCIRACLML